MRDRAAAPDATEAYELRRWLVGAGKLAWSVPKLDGLLWKGFVMIKGEFEGFWVVPGNCDAENR